jgi:hypothetical protein
MVATAGLSLTLDPMGKMFQDAKVDRNSKITTTAGHSLFLIQFDFGVVVSLTFSPYLIIFIFEHFTIGSNVNQCPAVAAILDFGSA